ncbi:MAG: hypothetical protein NZ772_04825 [Cyanobacteria bacterium]|nr:hypothetical protein [Cyanobacteriota bacterium]MDW8200787.1 hypothetical protein [Cyanobacteriota bacterium SKYGB_h_bin112]
MVRLIKLHHRLRTQCQILCPIRWGQSAAVAQTTARVGGVVLGVASLMAVAQPPALASIQDYESCAQALLNAKIEPATVADYCARELQPHHLGACVTAITQRTTIAANDALEACARVRRPLDLANCVVNIDQQIIVPKKLDEAASKSALLTALDTCRRSLLPIRHAECVIGLSKKVDLPPLSLMGTCIDADDRPRDVQPTFIRS